MLEKDSIYPSYIDNTDFRYIKLDDKYIASIIIYDFPKYNTFLSIIESIPRDIEYTMSIYVKKQDTYKILKELTYSISTSKSEIKTAKSSQIDIDIITKSQDDANLLRKEIQINNQEIFYINFILTFYSNNSDELLKILKRFQSRLYSKQIYSKIANFRQLDEYILSLPLNRKDNILLKQNFRNLTTNATCNIFPFYTKTIFDTEGIIFGKILSENSICNVDMFKIGYLNSNMCILGSSGAGKSFFAKLLIIRHYINKKNQYIFDLEGEYVNIVKELGGSIFSFSENHINILEFKSEEINEYKADVYDIKVKKVTLFLKELLEIDDKEIDADIKMGIYNAYNKFNINSNLESLFIQDENKIYLKKMLKKNKEFPTLHDVYMELKLDKSKIKFKEALNKYPYLFGVTDVNFKNSLVLFNISSIGIQNAAKVVKYILQEIILKLKVDMKIGSYIKNTLIYVDEFWKYILSNNDKILLEYFFELFKTIRKLRAGIIIITQDISDIFSEKNINYGKSMLNNCFFKVIFKLDFNDISVLNNISGINNEILESINLLDKGQSLIMFNNSSTKLLVQASDYEKELIEGGNNRYIGCNWE